MMLHLSCSNVTGSRRDMLRRNMSQNETSDLGDFLLL